MKKILVFGLTGTIGGIETFFMTYYRKLDKKEYQVDFATVYDTMVFEKEIINNGGKIYRLTDFRKSLYEYKKEIKSILNNNNYDTIYINMLSAANIIPLKISYKMKVKNIIVHSHNSNTPRNILKRVLHVVNKNKIRKYSTKLIACSNKAGKWMFGKSQYTVLNNAIDLTKFSYNYNYSQEYKHSCDEYIVGHIGRYCEQKNHEFILDIAQNMKKYKNIKFVLIGEGENKNKIYNDIRLRKLDNIITLEPREDVYKLYNSFDMFILPSKFEGLPIVGIEAQANGLPCCFSNYITRELMINNNVCFLPINNINTWVNVIKSKPKRTKNINIKKCGYDIEENFKLFEEFINN